MDLTATPAGAHQPVNGVPVDVQMRRNSSNRYPSLSRLPTGARVGRGSSDAVAGASRGAGAFACRPSFTRRAKAGWGAAVERVLGHFDGRLLRPVGRPGSW